MSDVTLWQDWRVVALMSRAPPVLARDIIMRGRARVPTRDARTSSGETSLLRGARESEQASEREKKRMVCAAAKVEGGCFERCDGTSVSGVVV